MLCVTLNSGGNANAVAGRNSPAAVVVAPPPPPAAWERRPAAEAMLEDVGDPGSPEYVLASLDTSLPPTSSSMFHGERSLVLTTTGAAAGAMDGSGLFDTPRQTAASPPPAPKRPASSTSSIAQPPPSTVAERAAIKAAEYAARREARAEQQALKEMQDATFKPRINSTRTTPPPFQQHNSSFNTSYSSSAAGTTPIKDSGSRLYDDAKERAARREARRLQLESDVHVECRPSQHHDPQHVDRLFEWEQQRRARLNEAARSAELATLATVTLQPAIDPVSRALAMSAAVSASHRSSRTSSPAQHRATPPPPAATPSSPAPVITSEQKAALVDRLYYQDAEVKRLERQLAEVRAAKDARRAHTPTITRQSTIIAGTSIPCSSSVYDRLTKEGVRADVRRSLREVETEVARREEADVGKYLGTMTHLLGTLAKQKRAAAAAVGTPPRDSKGASADLPGTPPPPQAAKVDTRSFSPSINAKSRAIDTAKSDGSSGLRRVELLLEKGQRTEQHKERLRLQKLRDEEQRLEEERREAARLVAAAAKSHASKTGDISASGAPAMRFEDRQRLWAANRELVIKRRQEEARALQDSVLQNECTFTPRTLTKKRYAAAAAAAGSLSSSMDMRQHSVSVGDDSESAAGGRAPSPEARPPCVLLDLCTSP